MTHPIATSRGYPLPHPTQNAAEDATRIRNALLAIDGDVVGLLAAYAGVAASIGQAVADLVGAAPGDLDTIHELAAALQNNPDVLTAIQEAISARVPQSAVGDVGALLLAADSEPDGRSALGFTGVGSAIATAVSEAAARAAIGAGTSSFSGNYPDLADKPAVLSESDVNSLIEAYLAANPPPSPLTTGMVMPFWGGSGDYDTAQWLQIHDSTIGNTGSGATSAGPQYEALFKQLYARIADAEAPVTTSGGGATTRAAQGSAATAWGAGVRLRLPLALGRAWGVAGAGSGLTSRTLGAAQGAETKSLSSGENGAHTHHVPMGSGGSGVQTPQVGFDPNTGTTSGSSGSGTAFSLLQPTTWFNALVKL
jgi:hypothetical protein